MRAFYLRVALLQLRRKIADKVCLRVNYWVRGHAPAQILIWGEDMAKSPTRGRKPATRSTNRKALIEKAARAAKPVEELEDLEALEETEEFEDKADLDGSQTEEEGAEDSDLEAILSELQAIARLLVSQGHEAPQETMLEVSERFLLLGLYRGGFRRVATEFENAAHGLENGHGGTGFSIFRSILRFPDAEMVLEASPHLDLEELKEILSGVEEAKAQFQGAVIGLGEAMRPSDRTTPLSENREFVAGSAIASLPASVAVGPALMLAGLALERLVIELSGVIKLFSLISFLGICPDNKCSPLGVISCTLVEMRIHAPVRKYSTYSPSPDFNLPKGAVGDVINNLADRLLSFLKTGSISDETWAKVKAVLEGGVVAGLVKKWLSGTIPIEKLVEAIMARLAPILGTKLAAGLAAVLFVALGMAVFTVAVAKLYSRLISQNAQRGILICVKVQYTVCVDGICYDYPDIRTINLKVLGRAIEVYGDGLAGFFTGVSGLLNPQSMLIYQRLLDQLTDLKRKLSTETNAKKRMDLEAQKIEIERLLASMKAEAKVFNDIKAKASANACAVLKKGDDIQTIKLGNFEICD